MELVKKKVTVTHWQAELVGSEQTYQTGQATDLHLFLEDEAGEPIEDADVAVTLDRPVTVHQINKVMHHVEGGLYVAEAVFSLPGTWVVMVEATQGDKQYKNEYLIEVEGPIIAEESRDPDDLFKLEQKLPNKIREEIQRLMNEQQ